jgi:hypothetical protein
MVDWAEVWRSVAAAVEVHVKAGRGHLLTEDAVRFALIAVLEDHGVAPADLRIEVIEERVGGKLDLVVGDPASAVVELKFPRDSRTGTSPDTMTLGEMLKDFFRLARLDAPDRWVMQLVNDRLRRFLERRDDIDWTFVPGASFAVEAGTCSRLPMTARRQLPDWCDDISFTATCVDAHAVAGYTLATYRLT